MQKFKIKRYSESYYYLSSHGGISTLNRNVMEQKSRNNLLAAYYILNSAQKEQVCCASVHCSYYAVFQYMKYIVAHLKIGAISYDDQDEICYGEDSHEIILSKIRDSLANINPKKQRDLLESVRCLKRQRVSADYSQEPFSLVDCLEIKQNAESLISKLKSYFNNKVA